MTIESFALVDASASAMAPATAGSRSLGFITRRRVALLNAEIARIECLLSGEFATTDIEPVLREHEALCSHRDALQRQDRHAA